MLKAGSVWFQARLLASNSPINSFTGFRIKGGTLTLTEDAARAGGGLDLSPTTIATFIADLDPPASVPVASGPGVDAAAAAITLPASVTIQFDPAGAKLTALSDSEASVYDQTTRFHWAGAASSFEGTTNEIATPLGFAPNQFQFGEVQSKLSVMSGAGPIQAASWALPVAVTTAASLGEAAGAGALLLTMSAGPAQQWAGLSQPATLNQTVLHLIPGQIVALAQSSGIQVSETFDLWQDSTVDFSAARPFSSFYLTQAGLEWFEVNGTSVAHLDRPLRADDSRFALKIVNGILLLFQTSTQFFAFIGTALNTEPKGTNAIALENALIVVDRKGAPMRDNNILSRHIKPAARAAKLEFVNWRCLRTSRATWMVEAGANPKDVQGQMRHSRISTTMDICAQFVPNQRAEPWTKPARWSSVGRRQCSD